MFSNDRNFHLGKTDIYTEQVVSIPVSLYYSTKGKYFVGQTGDLRVYKGSVAWASLVNPYDSKLNLFANVFTISNFSDEYLTAEIWLNSDITSQGGIKISKKVSPANTSLRPLPKNKVNIEYIESTAMDPSCGKNVYDRIVPPKTTLVGEEDGKFIEAPNGNYTLIIKSQSENLSKVIVAFGWWEK